ncbi:T9SS type A sorting domain-containing protein [Rhodothermus marinus]|uniref:T9SS type A sorting domain-containing protein n=1 Tax=Rhodothermus marinus TaxID=29549 RepID=UPI0037CA7E2D
MQPRYHYVLRIACLLLLHSFLGSAWVQASHLRGASLYAEATGSAGEVRIVVIEFWRYAALGTDFYTLDGNEPDVGDFVRLASEGWVDLGDGTVYGDDPTELFEVIGFNDAPEDDWVALRAVIVHRYPTAGAYDVQIGGCCRPEFLRNASDAAFRFKARVLVDGSNASAVVSASAFVGISRGNPATYLIPYTNPDGDQLRFRFATPTESGIYYLPLSVLSIDPETGLISWNNTDVTRFPDGSQWAVQVIIEEYDPGVDPEQSAPKAWTALDFIFRIEGEDNQLPSCTLDPPAPLTVNLGDPVSILITGDDAVGDADDNDSDGNTVSISAVHLPAGATLTPNPALGAAPQTALFEWTPSAIGVFNAAFTVSDGLISTTCSAEIRVVQPSVCTPAVIQSERVSGNQGIATFYSPDGIEQILFTALNNLTVVSVQGTGGETFSGAGMGPYVLDAGYSPPTTVEVVFQQVDPNVPTGTYFAEVSTTCPSEPGGLLVANLDPTVAFELRPARFALEGPMPNPTEGLTTLRLALPEASQVSVVVYDVLGRAVARLAGGEFSAGVHEVRWLAGSGLPSGTYMVRVEVLEAGGTRRVAHRLVTLLR